MNKWLLPWTHQISQTYYLTTDQNPAKQSGISTHQHHHPAAHKYKHHQISIQASRQHLIIDTDCPQKVWQTRNKQNTNRKIDTQQSAVATIQNRKQRNSFGSDRSGPLWGFVHSDKTFKSLRRTSVTLYFFKLYIFLKCYSIYTLFSLMVLSLVIFTSIYALKVSAACVVLVSGFTGK